MTYFHARTRAMIAALAALATMLVAAPAEAGTRIHTTSHVSLQPGQGAVMHSGDPIRICATATSEKPSSRRTAMAIDMRLVGKRWQNLLTYRQGLNSTYCLIGQVHGRSDIQVRVRTITNPDVKGSISRTVTIDMAAR
jgi:hypothetical protein